jgi:acyl dehydratase
MILTVAQIAAAQDLDLGASEWFRIDQQRIEAFAEATEDRQWIHIDPERAKESRFGTTIAHGYLLISLLPRLLGEIFVVEDAEMLVNYGLDKVRFIAPVPSGAEIRLEAKIASATPQRSGHLLKLTGDLVIKRGDSDRTRRAVATETLMLVLPKTTAPAEATS